MSVINTNIKSLITQNNLTVNNRALSSAMEKLSTGKRINSASDDAAGLAISNKMTAQIRGLNQSVRNANDGISMVQTAEGALTEVSNMLQRMRELAVQSATDTNTSSDRYSLNLEYQQLGREISRIATNTQWNAMNILNNTEVGVAGTSADVGAGVRNVKFQVGANPNQVINIGLKDFSYGVAVGTTPSEASFTLGDLSGLQNFGFQIGSQRFGFSTTNALSGTVASTTDQMTEEELVDFETQMNKAITDTNGFQNVSVTRVGNTIYVRDAEGRPIGASALSSFSTSALQTAWVNGYPASGTTQPADGTTVAGGVSINAGSQAGAVTSESKFDISAFTTATGIVKHKITVNSVDFEFTTTNAVSASTTASDEVVTKMQAAFNAVAGYQNIVVSRDETNIYVRDDQGRSIGAYVGGATTSYGTTATKTQISQGLPPPSSTAVFSGSARLNDTNIKTQASSNLAISRLDNAMANVDQERATFGSIMNRLTYAGDNLTNVSQNTSQSRSRVLDTDYASATTELARTQIIQQAGMAMLAQANQQPQTVLALLK